MANTNFDCIIIGSGMGGLTAGATLAKQGKKVLVLEQHYIPGGCATSFKRGDFLMEVGLHEMDGLDDRDHKHKIFKYLGVDKNITFRKAPEFFRLIGDNIDFIHPDGYKETKRALIARYPKDRIGISIFLRFMRNIHKEIPRFPKRRWVQTLLFPIKPLFMPNIVLATLLNLGLVLDILIRNKELKLLLLTNLPYYHDNPYTMSMIYFAVAQASYISGGGHFIKGGSQQLSNYLVKCIEEQGGQLLLGKKVTEIITKNRTAQGVVFSDAYNPQYGESTLYANTIIANLAIPLVCDILPDNARKGLARRISRLKPSVSLFSIYIGFKKEIKDLGNKCYNTFINNENVKKQSDLFKGYHDDWKNRGFVFVDYSQIDSGLAPKGKSFGSICTTDYWEDWEGLDEIAYREKKEEVAQILFDRLEKIIPGIKEEIEYYEVGTSRTINSYTLNPKGAPYGFAQTTLQSGLFRIGTKSHINNLYFASAWGYPGGGFTGAILSGWVCAQVLKNRTASSSIPEQVTDERILNLVKKEMIAENTIELTFEKPKDFNFVSGQYAVLEILNPKYTELDMPIRHLSMASHPDENHVKFAMRLSHSSYKRSLEEASSGDRFRMFGPMGESFLTPEHINNKRGIIFLISGIGSTPIVPVLKDLEKQKFDAPVYLFYSNRTVEKTTYHTIFKKTSLKKYNYVPVFTGKESRINSDLIHKHVKEDMNNFDFYLVGTRDFVNNMHGILKQNNIDKDCIFIDDFGG